MTSEIDSQDALPPPGRVNPGERGSSVLDRLVQVPYGFDFFQVVRLIELAGTSQAETDEWCGSNHVGEDFAPSTESVRFRVAATQGFPGSEIVSLIPPRKGGDSGDVRFPAQMTVTFLGLTGPSGVLPQHYTQRLIDQLREDDGMREFLDIFNHRTVSLFYRAWKKYRFPIAYEAESRSRQQPVREVRGERELDDPFSFGMYSFIGLGTGALRGRQEIPDERFLYYAGQFAQHPRTAVSLERMIGDYFGWPTKILQFIGQWLELRGVDRTRLSSDAALGNNCLGATAVAGERVWGIENKFRVRLGPLSYSEFRELIPGRRWLSSLAQFVRSYVGPDLEFDVQLVLRQDEVPACRLAGEDEAGSHLGWDCWLRGQAPLDREADDSVFQVEGYPAK
jgi:type VI secretion system protein ImpH